MIKLYLTADEVAGMLGVSKAHAYTLIRGCNDELKADGYITVAGKVSKKYFGKKYFGYDDSIKED